MSDKKQLEAIDARLDKMSVRLDDIHRTLLAIARDRLRDRHALQADHQRLKELEAQVMLMSQHQPGIDDWEPELATLPGVQSPMGPRPPSISSPELERLEDLEEKLAEEERRKRESVLWWRRQRWTLAFAACGFVLATIVTGCAGYVAYRVKSLEHKLDTQTAEQHRSGGKE